MAGSASTFKATCTAVSTNLEKVGKGLSAQFELSAQKLNLVFWKRLAITCLAVLLCSTASIFAVRYLDHNYPTMSPDDVRVYLSGVTIKRHFLAGRVTIKRQSCGTL
jgi:hypothetical protein